MDLEKDWGRFTALDVEMVNIMVDPKPMLAKTAREYGFKSPVLADEDKKVSTLYDALNASMHPGSKPGHTFILVNKAGIIIWRRDWGAMDAGMMYTSPDDIYNAVSEWLQKRGSS